MPDMPASIAWDYPEPFIQRLQPAAEDIDGLNHVNNAVYVRWCEQVAWKHSERLGLGLSNYRILDRAMAIRRGEYNYLLPARLGDEIELATWLVKSDGKLALERRFQLGRPADGAILLRAKWELVCIELSSGKPKRMPPEFSAAYNGAIISLGS